MWIWIIGAKDLTDRFGFYGDAGEFFSGVLVQALTAIFTIANFFK